MKKYGKTIMGRIAAAAVILCIAALVLAGCGSRDIYLAGQMRVAVTLYAGTVAGDPYNENCALGFERLRERNIDSHFFENPENKPFEEILAEAVNTKPNVVWCLDSRGAEAAAAAAALNPDIQFITLEHAYADPAPNLAGVYFDSLGASFLAGYLAATATDSGEVGIAGGAASTAPEEFGFKAGVIFAGNSLGKSIRVHSAFAGDDYDGAAAEKAAASLYGKGCDVVFNTSGRTAAAAVAAAQSAGRFLICLNYGQYTAANAPEEVIAFVAESLDARAYGVTEMAVAAKAGGLGIGGQNHFFGFPTNSVRLERNGDFFTDQDWAEMNNVLSRVLAGEFTVPAEQESLENFVAAAAWRQDGG
jgi:basic membrane lipoprotein Med (substrate-binding protein (PBP1-ABC) superfamily)